MTDIRKKFHRETPDQRKADLIAATLRVITRAGMQAATVRTIAQEADVTQGLIRHYFQTKEDLISAAYEAHLNSMTQAARGAVEAQNACATAQLTTFITASIAPPASGPDPLGVWASFLPSIRREKVFLDIHRRINRQFRAYLSNLIKHALLEQGITCDEATLKEHTLMCGCIIDGVWLEAGLFDDIIDIDKLTKSALIAIHKALDFPTLE
jgi:AcrR family transcriptional regulator